MPNSQPIYEVVIAGGGPVGLFLACELRLAGVSVRIPIEAGGVFRSEAGRAFRFEAGM